MINKLLLIVDPQIDFITGVLPVPGAVSSMNSLAGYLRRNSTQYAGIIVTADRHPMRHCSFRTEAGQWPVHCVAATIRDLLTLDGNIRLNVLKKFSPSIDGGNTLDSLISKYSLSCTR